MAGAGIVEGSGGPNCAAVRALALYLGERLLGVDGVQPAQGSAQALIKQWIHQRWRPQFGGEILPPPSTQSNVTRMLEPLHQGSGSTPLGRESTPWQESAVSFAAMEHFDAIAQFHMHISHAQAARKGDF